MWRSTAPETGAVRAGGRSHGAGPGPQGRGGVGSGHYGSGMTTALITGATAGIGAAFARRLAADGHDVVLVARDLKRLREQATELHDRHGVEAEVLAADLSSEDGIGAVEARLSDPRRPVDLLVNNAGFGNKGRFLDVSMADELRMLTVHCEAVLRLTSAAAAAMKGRGRGGVVNVASVAAFVPRGTYGASKAWVVQFTQGAARDLAGSGVRLMALCPGFVRTEFHERAGMGTDNIPGWMWLDADKLVAAALSDLARGRTLSIPDPRYKALMGVVKLAPRALLGGVSSKAGRKYGPQ
ncbi:SDR family oxidoreductase [Streptomyces roseofulvus]